MKLHGISRRSLLAFGSAVPFAHWSRAEEAFPSKPITLLVGFAPGGQSDILARKVGKLLEADLRVPVVVKNVPGAASTMSLRQLLAARPDGYTLAVTGGSGLVMAPLIMKVPYSPAKSFKTVGMLTSAGGAIAVHPSLPVRSLSDLVRLVKASPDAYSYAHSGIGGIDHLTGELFKMAAGNLKLIDVPFAGAAPAVQATIAGQVPILSATFTSAYKFHQSGQLRMLAITSAKRSETAPDVPTAIEQGYKELLAETYNLVTAPASIPAEPLARLRSAMAKIMAQEGVVADLRTNGYEPAVGMTPDTADQFLASETKRWRTVVDAAHITAE